MNKRIIYIWICLFFVVSNVSARSYFQQEVNYRIKVTLDDVNHTLNGSVTMEYINNSPDTLQEIYIHLWPNAYRDKNTELVKQQVQNNNTRLFFAKEEERGYIDNLNFTSGSDALQLSYAAADIGVLKLNHSLLPGKTITISTPFHVKIPASKFSRLGHNQEAYYISQWYPKAALYDDKGWHAMSYLDIGEFFNDFGSYEVEITLPANYVVCATGELQNEEEKAWLDLKSVKGEVKPDNKFPPSDSRTKTLIYRQNNIHDFAWFADKRYQVSKGAVYLPETKRRVDTYAFYLPASAKIWKSAVDYINASVYKYSLWNGEYIYSACSVAEAPLGVSDGMEYPMISLLNAADSIALEGVIVHEVGHNWFQGMLASNEREDPWMDEGINSFYEMRFLSEKYEKYVSMLKLPRVISKATHLDHFSVPDFYQFEYSILAKNKLDGPSGMPAPEYNWLNYGAVIYRKNAVSFNYLKSYLGEQLFDQCMKEYFRKWKMRHPSPEDISQVFYEMTKKDLTWFWEGLIEYSGGTDYALKGIDNNNGSYSLDLKNSKKYKFPFSIQGLVNDSVIFDQWYDGFLNDTTISISCSSCTEFIIDKNKQLPEENRMNNNIYTAGLCRKRDHLSVGLFPEITMENRRRISVLPAVAWNDYNKWMAGLAIYNKTIPFKKFEYAFAAFYGFGDKEPAGTASLNYNFFSRKGLFSRISPGIKARRFAYDRATIRTGENTYENPYLHYTRIEPFIDFYFRKKLTRSNIYNTISLSSVNLLEEGAEIKRVLPDYKITGVGEDYRYVFRASWNHENRRSIDPYSVKAGIEGNENYQKFYLSASYTFSYGDNNKGFHVRWFNGVENAGSGGEVFPFVMSGWSGREDYWYDGYYLGRSNREGILSQQMMLNEGAFKTYIPYATSAKWLSAINLEADLPGVLPLKVFFDAGAFEGGDKWVETFGGKGKIIYDAGVCITGSYLTVYLPFLRSADIKGYQSGDYGIDKVKFSEQIRFVFDINQINPFYIRDRILY